MILPAFSVYQKRAIPPPPPGVDPSAPGADVWATVGASQRAQQGLHQWLNVEFGQVQSAIPVRTTKTVTAAYTLTVSDDIVLVDATAGPVTVTWPDPTRVQHGTWTVKKIDASGNAVTFASTVASTGAAATFDGATSPTLVSRWDSRTMRSDGVAYYQTAWIDAIVGGSVPAADVTHGTFGGASGDTNPYNFTNGIVTGIGHLPSPTMVTAQNNNVTFYGDSASLATALRVINAATSSNLALGRYDGTPGSPTAVVSGDTLGLIDFQGYDGTAVTLGSGARVQSVTTQNWSNTARGGKLQFQTVPNGSTTLTTALTLDQDQSATFSGAVSGITTLGSSGAATLDTGAHGSSFGWNLFINGARAIANSPGVNVRCNSPNNLSTAIGIEQVNTGTSAGVGITFGLADSTSVGVSSGIIYSQKTAAWTNGSAATFNAKLFFQTLVANAMTTYLTLDGNAALATFGCAGSFGSSAVSMGALTATTGTFSGAVSGITTLTNTGAATLDTGASGSSFGGALNVVGNFSVASTKFTVASASGNTAVAGTSTLTGFVGVGGAPSSQHPLYVSATGSGVSQYGVFSSPTLSSAASSGGGALYLKATSAAAAFTMSNLYTAFIDSPTLGSGSSITGGLYGLYIAAMTVGGGSNYAIFTNAGLVSFGDNVTIASGKTLQLGNARVAGVVVQGGTVTIKDSTGATITLLTT